MDFFDSILYGFQVTFQPINFLFCGVGVLVGTLVGVLPGIGPAGAMALLLPATFKFSSTSTIILLAGIYYGVQYGGSTTSILVNIPGEASSVMTCIDGHQMARQGRAGPALGIAAWGSFIAGTIANIGLMLVAIPLAHAALRLGPPEYFALMCTGLIIVTYLAQGSVLKAIMMGLVGIILGSIGLDLISGFPRFTFGINELTDGVGIVPLVMGLFGISEILENLEGSLEREVFKTRIKNLWPSFKDWMESKWAIVRGSVIGFVLGILPGGGAVISTFVSYAVEKKSFQASGEVRQRCHRRSGRSGVREQCGCRGLAHSSSLARNPSQPHHGHLFLRPDHSRNPARSSPDQAASRSFLGLGRQPVSGQCASADSEPSLDRTCG